MLVYSLEFTHHLDKEHSFILDIVRKTVQIITPIYQSSFASEETDAPGGNLTNSSSGAITQQSQNDLGLSDTWLLKSQLCLQLQCCISCKGNVVPSSEWPPTSMCWGLTHFIGLTRSWLWGLPEFLTTRNLGLISCFLV